MREEEESAMCRTMVPQSNTDPLKPKVPGVCVPIATKCQHNNASCVCTFGRSFVCVFVNLPVVGSTMQ